MRKIIYCLNCILLTCLFSCNNGDGNSKNMKEFEGVITYKILYKNKDDTPVYGDTMRIFYSKGNVAKVYNSQGTQALRKEVFLGESRRYFIQRAMSDTILTYDMGNPGPITLMGTKRPSDGDVTILRHVCKKIEFDERYSGKVSFYMSNSFYYATDVLKVDKHYFKDWNFGNFNTFINEAGVYYLKFQTTYQYGYLQITRSYTAVNIKEQKIDPSIFYIDTTKSKALVF